MTEALSVIAHTAKQADHRLTCVLTADFASSCHSQHCLPPLQEQYMHQPFDREHVDRLLTTEHLGS